MSFRKILAECLGLPQSASDDELASVLADVMAPKFEQAPTGGKKFVDMVADVMASEKNLSYGDACAKVSRENPDAYVAHMAESSLN
jgi:hypothetical protein